MKIFKNIIYWVLFFIIGFGIPYLVHFKFNYFGANFISPADIFALWILTPMATFLLLTIFIFKK